MHQVSAKPADVHCGSFQKSVEFEHEPSSGSQMSKQHAHRLQGKCLSELIQSYSIQCLKTVIWYLILAQKLQKRAVADQHFIDLQQSIMTSLTCLQGLTAGPAIRLLTGHRQCKQQVNSTKSSWDNTVKSLCV